MPSPPRPKKCQTPSPIFPISRNAYALKERTKSISHEFRHPSQISRRKDPKERPTEILYSMPRRVYVCICIDGLPPRPSRQVQNPSDPVTGALVDRAQQLSLKDEFPLLVLLRHLKRLIILPPHRLFTLPALDIPHNVFARSHMSFYRFRLGYVYYRVE